MKLPVISLAIIAGMLTSCEPKKVESNELSSPATEPATEQPEVAPEPEVAQNPDLTFQAYEVDWTLPVTPPNYAKNVYNTAAPEIVVEEWISEEPEMAGKFVIVDFWATWCGPCRAMIPHMNQLSKQFADEVVCVALSDEPSEKVKKMTMPVIEYYSAVDTKATAKKAIEIRGIPLVIVIDPNGKVCWEGHPSGLSEEKLREMIDFYVAAKN